MTSPLRNLTILSVSLLFAGCTSSNFFQPRRTAKTCPAAYILRDLSRQTQKDPEAGTILARTFIDQIKPRCHAADNKLEIQLNPQVTATRYDSEKPSEVEAPYFVALVDRQGQLVAKEVFPTTVYFEGRARRGYELPTDVYELEIPEDIDTSSLVIYTGFQMEDQQWVENKQLYTKHQLAGNLP